MLDALAYAKAARANGVPAALELSQSGRGAHVWTFFTDWIPAATARAVGTVLVHEATVLRGSMDLHSYDRLFPNQDTLPEGGFGNLIAAPLQGQRRRNGLTVFLDLAALEPHDDQWVFLSTVDRLSPGDAQRVALLAALLGVKAGQVGGGRRKLTGIVDIAMLPSLARHHDISTLTQGYGHAVIDECHHLAAAAYDHSVKRIGAQFWLGLTATPERRDGLGELVTWQLGPVRRTLAQPDPAHSQAN